MIASPQFSTVRPQAGEAMYRLGAFVLVLGLILVISMGCSRPAPPTENTPEDTEDMAVAFVEKLGGKVIRDENQPGKPVVEVDLTARKATDVGTEGTGTHSKISPRSPCTARR